MRAQVQFAKSCSGARLDYFTVSVFCLLLAERASDALGRASVSVHAVGGWGIAGGTRIWWLALLVLGVVVCSAARLLLRRIGYPRLWPLIVLALCFSSTVVLMVSRIGSFRIWLPVYLVPQIPLFVLRRRETGGRS